ncbi:hypothetical protein bcere0017_43150 [Bacillus cereus Rock1-3]|nr:hypothetical protein MC28_3836 [Bacillus thuringiensis MC28]EEL20977.1 hypothetical protein bcere0017_43150 [Bacillus cereus Rock1-3]EEL32337.1 hypothetical protein bcere0019_43160 [Bacillus cereus Rock3-28]EEL38456.1 hypothetical protein bcere0020_42380 [Bacillus cereus Rock3-29]
MSSITVELVCITIEFDKMVAPFLYCYFYHIGLFFLFPYYDGSWYDKL